MATIEAVKKHLTCSICLEVFKVPKTLSCLHTFCELCLDSHIRGSINSDKSFLCPICRAKTFPQKPASVGNWAKSFPTNHYIVSLLDDTHLSQKLSEVEQDSVKECVPCKLDDKNIKALYFCIQCVEYLCKGCNESHRKFKSTRNHTVLKGNKQPTNISAFQKLSKIRFCITHTDKEVEFKCVKHNVFMCSLCVTTQHKNCEAVEHSRRVCGQYTLKSENSLDKIETLKTDVEKALEYRLKKTDGLENESKRIINQSSEIIEQLKALTDHLENKFLTHYKEHVKFEQRKLAISVAECLTITENLNQMSEVTNLVLKYGSPIQNAIVYNQLSDNVIKVNNFIKAQEDNCSAFPSEYLHCEIEAMKQSIKEVYKNLENICTTETKQLADSASALLSSNDDLMDKNSLDSINRNTDDENVETCSNASALALVAKSTYMKETLSLFKRSVRKIGEHDISLPRVSAAVCNHNGSLLLDNGNMIFIDRSNRIMKMVSPDFKLICHTKFYEMPLDVCSRGKSEIIVAMSNAFCVVSVISNKDFQQREYIMMKDEILSICSVGNNVAILYASQFDDDQQFYIAITDNNHNPIETVDYFNACTSVPHTGNLKYAKVIRSRYTDEIIVCEPRRVRSFNVDGYEKWYFAPGNLQHADYIAFDSNKNMYICDLGSGTISQMAGYSYKRSREIIHDVRRPSSILYNPKDQTLVVGCKDDNKVHVYAFI